MEETRRIATAMDRLIALLGRRPGSAVGDDPAATACWEGGLRTRVGDDAGASVTTDMPAELGGAAASFSPGWLLRAALASCAVTRIAMAAAAAGIALETLDARATSRSDARGLLALPDADGAPVPAAPLAMALHVRVGAPGVPAERLRALVASTFACSPVGCAIEQPVALALHVDVVVP